MEQRFLEGLTKDGSYWESQAKDAVKKLNYFQNVDLMTDWCRFSTEEGTFVKGELTQLGRLAAWVLIKGNGERLSHLEAKKAALLSAVEKVSEEIARLSRFR